MLFHKKTRSALRFVWMGLGALIILSMVMLYTPVLNPSHGGGVAAPESSALEEFLNENTNDSMPTEAMSDTHDALDIEQTYELTPAAN